MLVTLAESIDGITLTLAVVFFSFVAYYSGKQSGLTAGRREGRKDGESEGKLSGKASVAIRALHYVQEKYGELDTDSRKEFFNQICGGTNLSGEFDEHLRELDD